MLAFLVAHIHRQHGRDDRIDNGVSVRKLLEMA
jgi:hypothetical protein